MDIQAMADRVAKFPPKADNYNRLPDAEGFWKLKVQETKGWGLRFSPKDMGDLIFYLNMAAMTWEDRAQLQATASTKTAAGPSIGPGVELQGKQGIYKITMGPSKLDSGPRGYNRMMESGYTHWIRLESPRGKEFEFYYRPDQKDSLYWYKNHRTLVPMRFKSVELPPDIKEIRKQVEYGTQSIDRKLGQVMQDALSLIDDLERMAKGHNFPQVDAAVEMIGKVYELAGTVQGATSAARRQMK